MAIKNIFKKKQWRGDYEAGLEAYNAGAYPVAEMRLRQALVKATDLGDASYGDTIFLLGQVLRRLERFEESIELTEKAFHSYSNLLGRSEPRVVTAHLALALMDPLRADHDDGLRMATYRRAVEDYGPLSWQILRLGAMVMCQLSGEELDELVASAQKACLYILGEGRQQLSTWPPVAQEVAQQLFQLGLLDLASKFMGFQLRIYEERYGKRSEEATLIRLRLGEFFLQNNQLRKAEIALSKAFEVVRLTQGAKSNLGCRVILGMVQAYCRQGKLAEAAPYFPDLLDRLNGEGNYDRIELLLWLLEYKCLVSSSDSERGAIWKELELVWEKNPSEQTRARIFEGLKAAQRRLCEAWELGPADRFLQAVLSRIRKWRGAQHPDVATTLMDMGFCASLRDDDAKALAFVKQSLDLDGGIDNLIRAVGLYAELGDRSRARALAVGILKEIGDFPPTGAQGLRHLSFARALLRTGEYTLAQEQCLIASNLIGESEAVTFKSLMAEAYFLTGKWQEAEEFYKEALELVSDPVQKAGLQVQYAWLLAQTSRFAEMQQHLVAVYSIASLRKDHPIIFQAKAVSSQGSYHSDNIYRAKEEMGEVLSFLRSGHHQQTRRALSILAFMGDLGDEEVETRLDIGTQILAAARFPEGFCSVFPESDAAAAGLRHLIRAFHSHGQDDLARERLHQYQNRSADPSLAVESPLEYGFSLCAAELSKSVLDKIKNFEQAVSSLMALSERHVGLFLSLIRLTESYLEAGEVERARAAASKALAIRKNARVRHLLDLLDQSTDNVIKQNTDGTSVDGSLGSTGRVAQEALIPDPGLEMMPPVGEESLGKEDESLVRRASISLPAGLDAVALGDSGTLVAYAGASDVRKLPLVRELTQRDEPPTEAEIEEILAEVALRYGKDRQARKDSRVALSLLFPDGSDLALKLWKEALEEVFQEDFETLLELENKAREANADRLVLATLRRRLSDETDRFGEQATESIDTLMRMSRVLERRGEIDEAYQRVTIVTEILRSWFGPRSRRLLDPLNDLIRLSQKRDDAATALAHHLEHHNLLEISQASLEELFLSRISLLPIRALLGQVDDLMRDVKLIVTDRAVVDSGAAVSSQLASVLLESALRINRLHWRVVESDKLLELALSFVPEGEASLACRLQIARAESQSYRDYSAQAESLRRQVVIRADGLESEVRAEIFEELASSCLSTLDVRLAREFAEKLLEERISSYGRKDKWAGRALLALAEADLLAYRLEGTETAIAMCRPSLEGSLIWSRCQRLLFSAKFFLGSIEEAWVVLDSIPYKDSWRIRLATAVWRGHGEQVRSKIESLRPTFLAGRWGAIESLPLDEVWALFDFFAQDGQVKLLSIGLSRLQARLEGLLPTDHRAAKFQLLRARLLFWGGQYHEAEEMLVRTIDILPAESLGLADGQLRLTARGWLVHCLLAQGKLKQAEAQTTLGMGEASEFLGEEDVRTLAFRAYLALCVEARGELDEAMVILDDILNPLQERVGDTHVLLRDIYRSLARIFLDQGDIESARMTAEEALRIDQECRGLSIHHVEDLHLLATIEQQEDSDEARDLLEAAVEYALEILPESHSYIKRLQLDIDELGRHAAAVIPVAEPISQLVIADSAEASFEAEPSIESWNALDSSLSEESYLDEDDAKEADSRLKDGWQEEDKADQDSIEDSAFEIPIVDFSTRDDSAECSLETELDDALDLEPVAEPVAFDEPEPVAEPVALDEPEPVAEPVAFDEPEPVAEPVALDEPEPVAEPLALDEPEPVAEPVAFDEPEPVAEPDYREEDEAEGAAAREGVTLATAFYQLESTTTEALSEQAMDFPLVPYRLPSLREIAELEAAWIHKEQAIPLAERVLRYRDLEDCFLPLAPIFYLKFPWPVPTKELLAPEFVALMEELEAELAESTEVSSFVAKVTFKAILDPSLASGHFLYHSAYLLEKMNKLELADLCLMAALELLTTSTEYGAACHLGGRIAGRLGKLYIALDRFERAIAVSQGEACAVVKLDIAECYLSLGRPEEALIRFDEAVDILAGYLPPEYVQLVRARFAQVHLLAGDIDSAVSIADDFDVGAFSEQDSSEIALIYLFFSRTSARLGRQEYAFKLAYKAEQILGDRDGVGSELRLGVRSHLFDLYRLLGELGEAGDIVSKSDTLGFGLSEAEIILRLGYRALNNSDFQLAQTYARVGLTLLQRGQNLPLWQSYFLGLEAEVALGIGNTMVAEEFSNRSLSLFDEESTSPIDRASYLIRAARIAVVLGDGQRAVALVRQANEVRELYLGVHHPHTESSMGFLELILDGYDDESLTKS